MVLVVILIDLFVVISSKSDIMEVYDQAYRLYAAQSAKALTRKGLAFLVRVWY